LGLQRIKEIKLWTVSGHWMIQELILANQLIPKIDTTEWFCKSSNAYFIFSVFTALLVGS
jgi:cell division protein FtsI/penicillin-binding protein 2